MFSIEVLDRKKMDGTSFEPRALDTLRQLVQKVSRAFYKVESIVILDVLSHHRMMTEEALSAYLQTPVKTLRKMLAFLLKDRLVAWEQRVLKEDEDGKPIKSMIWFIDYKRLVDVVRLRMFRIHKKLQALAKAQETESTNYACPGPCQRKFSLIEVLPLKVDSTSPEGYSIFDFVCDQCDETLQEIDNTETVKMSQQQQSKLIDQLKPINDLLKKTEEYIIPEYRKSAMDEIMDMKEYEEYKRQLQEAGDGASSSTTRRRDALHYYQNLDKEVVVNIKSEAAIAAAGTPAKQAAPLWLQTPATPSTSASTADTKAFITTTPSVVKQETVDIKPIIRIKMGSSSPATPSTTVMTEQEDEEEPEERSAQTDYDKYYANYMKTAQDGLLEAQAVIDSDEEEFIDESVQAMDATPASAHNEEEEEEEFLEA